MSEVLASTRPTQRQRAVLLGGGLLCLGVAAAMVGVWTQAPDVSAPAQFFLAAGIVCLAYVAVKALRGAAGREPWLEITDDEVRWVSVLAVSERLPISSIVRVEAQPAPKTIWFDETGRTRLTDLDPRRAAIRITGGGQEFRAFAGTGFDDVVEQVRRWVAHRPELMGDPPTIDMLGPDGPAEES